MGKIEFNMDTFQKIEGKGVFVVDKSHSIAVRHIDTEEDINGYVCGYITKVQLYHHEEDHTTFMYYRITPEESNYHAFVTTYKELCQRANICGVTWL